MQDQQKIILDFIKSQPIGVLATINAKGTPEASSMAISQTDKLELIFQTPDTTRKYANLQHNPHVAIVFGWGQDNYITVQYEGTAREVTDQAERERLLPIHIANSADSKPYVGLPGNKFFIVTPTQIKYSDIPNGVTFTLNPNGEGFA